MDHVDETADWQLTETWRAVPAEINLSGDEIGAWAVVAGDGEEADIYLQVAAEYPRRVAEFVAEAVRTEAANRRAAGHRSGGATGSTTVRGRCDKCPDLAEYHTEVTNWTVLLCPGHAARLGSARWPHRLSAGHAPVLTRRRPASHSRFS